MMDFAVNPRKLALVNVDLQNVFVEGTPVSPPDGPAVVAALERMNMFPREQECSLGSITHSGTP
jgi:hypothetical protein